MGQFVPLVKDNVSRECEMASGYIRRMSIWLDEAQFNDEMCARTQRLRLEKDWTQEQMAAAIGVPKERYKKYETRSPLPPYLIPRFAQICERTVSYIMTGKDEASMRGPRQLVRTRTGTSG